MTMTRRGVMLGAAAALLLPQVATAGSLSIGGPAFGSSWRASVVGADGRAISRRIESIIAQADACFSPYRADSALSRFNATRETRWMLVRRDLAFVTGQALEIAAETGGYFDPTVGPLVARQGFGPIAGEVADFTRIAFGDRGLRKRTPEATLDLCGIAKGHALDLIIGALQSEGVTSAIVDVGGEVRALGSHPDGRAWSVAIADPFRPGAARRILDPRGLAVATSGHSANGVRGRAETSHIIDPHRRAPASQRLLSVTVLDRSAARADALATALCAAGAEVGPEVARTLAVPALFILDDAEVMTGGVDAHILV